MNPHASYSVNILNVVRTAIANKQLISQMTNREVIGRYKGSLLGIAWSFIIPLLMLVVYTFVFSVIFKARWNPSNESKTEFAVVLFVGMIIHGLLAEVINKSPYLITSNANYVKKIIFPLELLSLITLGAALFHTLISMIVLLIAILVCNGTLYWTALYFPILLIPFVFIVLGLSWIFASLGVFARDVGQTVGVLMTVLMFLSPVFYSTSSLSPELQFWINLNPITFIVEQSRDILIWGKTPDFIGYAKYCVVSILIVWAGFAWFQKTRKGFADVL